MNIYSRKKENGKDDFFKFDVKERLQNFERNNHFNCIWFLTLFAKINRNNLFYWLYSVQ